MQVTIDTVEHNLLLGMALVLIVLIFFLVSVRAAIIVALTIPLSLLFSFIFLHARGIPANLLSIGAIDFGIIIDGTVVMMENIYRELAARHGQEYKLHEVIIAAAHDVGPAHFLFHRRHPRRLHSHLRAQRPIGQALSPHGGNDVVGAARLADLHPHVGSRARLLLVHARSEGKGEPRL